MSTKYAVESVRMIERQARFNAEYLPDKYPTLDDALLATFAAASRDEQLALFYSAIGAIDALEQADEDARNAALARDFT